MDLDGRYIDADDMDIGAEYVLTKFRRKKLL
jgi:hypothetical protein